MRSNAPAIDFIEFHILHHASAGDVYGLWVIEHLAERGFNLNASQLYPRLHRLERKGLLKRHARIVDGRRRQYYRMTASGRTYFRNQRQRQCQLVSETLSPQELERALKEPIRPNRRRKA